MTNTQNYYYLIHLDAIIYKKKKKNKKNKISLFLNIL